jgi:acetyl-CoA acyltransferase
MMGGRAGRRSMTNTAVIVDAVRSAPGKGKSGGALSAVSVTGDDPILILTGIVPATRKALDWATLSIDEIDAYEVNEAFAPVPLAWLNDVAANPARLNQQGGAIALGHALGASGARLLTTLEQTGGDTGCRQCATAPAWRTR